MKELYTIFTFGDPDSPGEHLKLQTDSDFDNLYVEGKKLKVEEKISLKWYERIVATVVALATVVIACANVYMAIKY